MKPRKTIVNSVGRIINFEDYVVDVPLIAKLNASTRDPIIEIPGGVALPGASNTLVPITRSPNNILNINVHSQYPVSPVKAVEIKVNQRSFS